MSRRRTLRVPSRLVPSSLCVVVAVFLLAIGFVLVSSPGAGGRVFGTSSEHAFTVATGVRQASLGAIVLILLGLRERRALGAVLLAMSAIPLADFLVVALSPDGELGEAASKHLPSVPLVVGLGIYFLKTNKGTGDRS